MNTLLPAPLQAWRACLQSSSGENPIQINVCSQNTQYNELELVRLIDSIYHKLFSVF